FSSHLGRSGIGVVSGLARGIDGAAHRAALEAGGRTIAVLGSGFGRVYPSENRPLARRIAESGQGALLSEFPWEAAPRTFHFPQRNRILSGLARSLLVVEAGERSGTLITADWALRQGKPVFVVPGRVEDRTTRGALGLLRDGAHPALDPSDVTLAFGMGPPAAGEEAPPGKGPPVLSGPLGRQLGRLFSEEDSWQVDALAERLDVSTDTLLVELSKLELDGALESSSDGAFQISVGRGRERKG
ncbi:MAG: DNA-processing protein DprA, partial [Planctomycetota bacterium]